MQINSNRYTSANDESNYTNVIQQEKIVLIESNMFVGISLWKFFAKIYQQLIN